MAVSALLNYSDTNRSYHNLDHIARMLRDLNAFFDRGTFNGYWAIVYATWYHDCIYFPGATDNEFRSALAAGEELSHLGKDMVREVQRLIMVTKDHLVSPMDSEAAKIISDLDLAGLSDPTNIYFETSQKVREEFCGFDDQMWFRGRKAFLESYLSREHLYHTEVGRKYWEEKARSNMQKELDYVTRQIVDG